MQTRFLPITLGLALVSTAVFAEPPVDETEPTVDERRCSELKKKVGTLKIKHKGTREEACTFECLDGAIVRAQHLTTMQVKFGPKSGIAQFGFFITDSGGYYLALVSYVYLTSGKKHGYKVRATKDALTLPLEDGTELELFTACDNSTFFTKMEKNDHYFCGFYKMTREQVEILSKNSVSGIQQFVVAVGDELEARRLEHTEDGRAYLDWVPRIQTDKSVDKLGVAPALNNKARCALAWEQ